jgi:cell division protein FtsL
LRRRQFLLTGLASAFVASAAAQEQKAQEKAEEQKADADLDLGPVKGTEELWYLLTALDALIFSLAVAVIKDQAVIVQARREIQPYSSQLSDPKAEETFNAALKSSEGQARIEQNKTAIMNAAKEVDALLTDVVSAPVRASVVHAFARASTLLVGRANENQSWWCRVYAFRKVQC